MAKNRIIGIIIASVVLSVIITSGVSYFTLPILFPGMIEDRTNDNEGIVLQSLYFEFDTPGLIEDSNLTYQKIPDTNASITIQENSRISVTFQAIFYLAGDPSFVLESVFNISIVVQGYGNRTYTMLYFQDGSGALQFIPINFYVTFITETLPADTYQVEVYWKSYIDKPGTIYLGLNYLTGGGYLENPRSLLLQELK